MVDDDEVFFVCFDFIFEVDCIDWIDVFVDVVFDVFVWVDVEYLFVFVDVIDWVDGGVGFVFYINVFVFDDEWYGVLFVCLLWCVFFMEGCDVFLGI